MQRLQTFSQEMMTRRFKEFHCSRNDGRDNNDFSKQDELPICSYPYCTGRKKITAYYNILYLLRFDILISQKMTGFLCVRSTGTYIIRSIVMAQRNSTVRWYSIRIGTPTTTATGTCLCTKQCCHYLPKNDVCFGKT